MIVEFDPNLMLPMSIVLTYKWPDGLFDVCWSEKAAGVCCTAAGDGSVLLWNEAKPVSYWSFVVLSCFYCFG